MLELTMEFMGNKRTIHPALVWDEDNAVLIDTGVPGQLKEFEKSFKAAGISFSSLNKIILTHQDIDHIGSLPEILSNTEKEIEVLAHKEDKPYIEGDKPIIKMNPERMKQMTETLPEDKQASIVAIMQKPPHAKVDTTIEDEQVLPICGGITVIFTPGHTPGHISLYLHKYKTLIAGDALVGNDGQIYGPSERVTPDMKQAMESIKKFTKYDIEKVICYHGGFFDDSTGERLKELAGEN